MKSLSIQPSGSLDALSALDVLRDGGGALVSYPLFEPGFVQALIGMGKCDAYARKDELLAFFDPPYVPGMR